jgi:S-methylmethionine-dependent homocysteine/selenocysteine methylase
MADRGYLPANAPVRRTHSFGTDDHGQVSQPPAAIGGQALPDRLHEAQDYHSWQAGIFRDTAADMISAFTMNYVEEAIGFTRAAVAADMPCVVSFTLETDGRLPTGQSLKEAIAQVDDATASAPAYYMINCAHPTHFADALAANELWLTRVRGLRANASTRSHAELDEATDLDAGDPVTLGRQYAALRRQHPAFTILGGCCGTDHRHVEQITFACTEAQPAAA